MCGRSSIWFSPQELKERYDAELEYDYEPSYNVAPKSTNPVIKNESKDKISGLRWGLVPPWADDPSIGNRMINARAETLGEKTSFKDAYERRRCIVPANAFFEWTGERGNKQPYLVKFKDDRCFSMAGLWERWSRDGDDNTLQTYTVITTEPNDIVGELHDRMPVILSREEEDVWLDEGHRRDDLLNPCPSDEMEYYPVSRRANERLEGGHREG
ncbi:MAG: SOS response-associated peptidase [Halobacteria archaeon]|nr:SOS response-associated peptidase [Halobacteria archaeon]